MPTINRQPHKKKEIQYKHENKSAKFYNSIYWQKLRHAYIVENPLCECCLKQDKITPANHVHHIKPFLSGVDDNDRWNLLLNIDNLMSVCVKCHNELHKKLKYKNKIQKSD